MMSLLPMLTALAAGLTLIITGLRLLAPALNRIFSRPGTPVSGTRAQGTARQFASGALSCILSLSENTARIFVLSRVDSRQITPTEASWNFAGIAVGSTAVAGVLALLGYAVSIPLLPLIVLAIALPLKLGFRSNRSGWGEGIAALGFLLAGNQLLSDSFVSLRSIMSADFPLWLVILLATVLPLLFRSTILILLFSFALATHGWVPVLPAAILILAGSLAASVDTLYRTRRLSIQARQSAVFQFVQQLCGLAGGMAALPVLYALPELLLPSALTLSGFFFISQIAGISIALPLRSPILKLSARLCAPDHPAADDSSWPALQLLDSRLQNMTDCNLTLLKAGLAKMADIDCEMLMLVMNQSQEPVNGDSELTRINDRLVQLNLLGGKIDEGLTLTVQRSCTLEQAAQIRHLQRVATELREIATACYKITVLLDRTLRRGRKFHEESREELFALSGQVLDFLRYIQDYLDGKIERPDLELARTMENLIDKVRNKLRKQTRKFLEQNQDADIKGELTFIEIIRYLENIGDNCLNIARTVPSM